MKYFELLKLSADYLKNKNIETAQLDAEILLSFADNITREKLISLLNYDVSEKTVIFFRKLIRLRGARIPIAYIIGEKEFYSYKFFVDESCLIPRPETEQIIDLAIDNYKNKNSKLKILDLCVGSGNICLTLLLKFSNAKAVAVDISEKALLALYNNAEYHSLLNRIMIINADVLSLSFYERFKSEKFDLLVCNPPYISENEYLTLAPEVKKEPKNALTPATNDNLIFYKKIIANLEKLLNVNGSAYFEISENIFAKLQNLQTIYPNLKFLFFNGFNNKPNVLKIFFLESVC